MLTSRIWEVDILVWYLVFGGIHWPEVMGIRMPLEARVINWNKSMLVNSLRSIIVRI